ncbi:RrF2 family transcriptional regulator [Chloroflexota bacterium]
MKKQVHLIKSDTDYAMRMLVYLAMNGKAEPVSAAVLVKAQKIPMDFAYKILQKLGKAKIVKSFKGPKGGFSLAQESRQITLLSIMEAVQGPLMIRPCLLDDGACPVRPSCPVSAQLRKLQKSLRESMQNITLAKIIRAKKGKPGSNATGNS